VVQRTLNRVTDRIGIFFREEEVSGSR